MNRTFAGKPGCIHNDCAVTDSLYRFIHTNPLYMYVSLYLTALQKNKLKQINVKRWFQQEHYTVGYVQLYTGS